MQQPTQTAERVVASGCLVGESLIWDDRRGLLFWVDMLGCKIHAFDPVSDAHTLWDTPEMVTSIGLCRDDGFVVGLQKTVAFWSPDKGFQSFAKVEPDQPGNRLNEGVVGPDGCFWIGTMQNNVDADFTPVDQTEKSGRVWRLSPNGRLDCMTQDTFWLTNTFAWRGDSVVIGDTKENTLYTYRMPTDEGPLQDRTTLLQDYAHGLPDGSCLDAEDFLWNCRVVGGAQVVRIGLDGTVAQIIETPCTWPTSCVFGGQDLDTLFIASARFTMPDAHLTSHPMEGDIFACKPAGIKGMLHHRFG